MASKQTALQALAKAAQYNPDLLSPGAPRSTVPCAATFATTRLAKSSRRSCRAQRYRRRHRPAGRRTDHGPLIAGPQPVHSYNAFRSGTLDHRVSMPTGVSGNSWPIPESRGGAFGTVSQPSIFGWRRLLNVPSVKRSSICLIVTKYRRPGPLSPHCSTKQVQNRDQATRHAGLRLTSSSSWSEPRPHLRSHLTADGTSTGGRMEEA